MITEEEIKDGAEPAEPAEAEPGKPAGRLSGLRGRLWRAWSRRTRIVVAVVTALLLAGAAGTGWLSSGRSIAGLHAGEGVLSFLPAWLPDGVAFRYGDHDVPIEELDRHVQMLRALYGVQAPHGKRLDRFRRDVAKSYAVSLILDDAAADHDIQVADKQARDTLTRFVGERLGAGPDAYSRFIATLADSGTSERVVLEELKRRLAMTRLFDTVTRDVGEPSDQDVRAAFDARQDHLATPERRRISNIVVQTKDDAAQVLRELEGGASFADVAARSSLDGSTRDKGGDLGTLSRDELEPDFADAAFAADAGEPFGPVRTQHGWNVGKVARVVPGAPARFDAIKDELRQELASERALTEWRAWLRAAIADADVRYADDYRPADPAAPPDTSPTEPGSAPR